MATRPHRLLGISGSLRAHSTNTAVLKALANRMGEHAELQLFALNDIPLYDSDLEADGLPDAVLALKDAISQADGLILCSPEYNYGVSGVLKNALDWASRPDVNSPLRNKPVLIMTSSPGVLGGVRAQAQLRETLNATLSREVVIPGVSQKIQDGQFEDEPTLQFMLASVDQLLGEIDLLGCWR